MEQMPSCQGELAWTLRYANMLSQSELAAKRIRSVFIVVVSWALPE